MRTRQEIKAQAKTQFKNQYGTSVGLFLLPALVSWVVTYAAGRALAWPAMPPETVSPERFLMLSAGFFVSSLLSFGISCLMLVLQVGTAGGYARIYRGMKARVAEPFTGLRQNFWRKYGSMLKMQLLLVLWMLLLCLLFVIVAVAVVGIAGGYRSGVPTPLIYALIFASLILMIVKALAYSLTPYILAEYPDVGAGDAIRLSVRMTRGHKGQLFVAWLSFIGWALLSAVTLGILAIFYVAPYWQTTMAGYYTELRDRAVLDELVSLNELGESEMRIDAD